MRWGYEYVCIYICMYVCIYIYNVYIYIHTRIHMIQVEIWCATNVYVYIYIFHIYIHIESHQCLHNFPRSQEMWCSYFGGPARPFRATHCVFSGAETHHFPTQFDEYKQTIHNKAKSLELTLPLGARKRVVGYDGIYIYFITNTWNNVGDSSSYSFKVGIALGFPSNGRRSLLIPFITRFAQ